MLTSNIRMGGKCDFSYSDCVIVVGARCVGLISWDLHTKEFLLKMVQIEKNNMQWAAALWTEKAFW